MHRIDRSFALRHSCRHVGIRIVPMIAWLEIAFSVTYIHDQASQTFEIWIPKKVMHYVNNWLNERNVINLFCAIHERICRISF